MGIAPAPGGVPQIEVTFDIDANGIVSVKAMDKGTNKSQSITISASSNLTEEEINKKVAEAEKYEAEDKARKEKVEAKNSGEQLIFAIEKAVKDAGDKLSDEDKETVTKACETAKADLEKADDMDAIKKVMEELSKVSDPVMTKLYQANAAENPQGTEGTDGPVAGDPDDIK